MISTLNSAIAFEMVWRRVSSSSIFLLAYFNSPHSDGKAFSLPATAHGLQGRFNARTVTKRKYPGSAPVPVEPALPHLWHGPVRSLSFTKTVFSEIRGHGGSVTQRVPLRIRVSFYSIFNLHEACLNLGPL